MIETIGFLELKSIAAGVESADAMLKAANVKLILARPNCPGKYDVLISGDVASVEAAVASGIQIGGANIIEHLVIPRIHPQVIQAIKCPVTPESVNAVGIVECFSITSSIQAADQAVKTSDVTLMDIRLGTGIGGKSFVVLTGDISAVKAAVANCTDTARGNGMLLGTAIIPSPRPEIFESLL